MAVTFTVPNETPFVIGGEINPANGLAGPFPRYSVSRESVAKDTLYIANKYNITITGTALIDSAASMLVEGARQNKIHDIIKKMLFQVSKQGNLEIAPYGGLANILQFDDAVLLSVDAEEQDDTSQGVQNQQYTFSFEAYNLTVNGEDVDDSIEADVVGTKYDLADVSESWEYNVNEEYTQKEYSQSSNPSVYRTYSITHNISATGRPKNVGGTVVKSGYIEAYDFVTERIKQLGNDPLATIVTDWSRGTPQAINIREQIEDTELNAYNLHQTHSKDILDGTYAVSRTWTVAKEKASSTIEFELNEDPSAEFNTVAISVSLSGYETLEGQEKPDQAISRKYVNAKALLDQNFDKSNLHTISQAFYVDRFPTSSKTLRTEPRAYSQTHNQTDGTISISATFDDDDNMPDNVLSQSVSINHVNEDGLDQIVAILAVIAKSDGPIIQDMKTTKERKRSITLEWLMKEEARSEVPNGAAYIETHFKPKFSNASLNDKVYRENMTETWNYKSGQYQISVDYVWTAAQPLRTLPNAA